ncbi:coniferyl aldehyde dehydrogenase [Moraxellaceae bacterium AER2_44_116]|nr:coniferyl aldehyde dehydrogenase [Moraxellaceae bacterium]TQC97188.1 coniferyl aldehyde dehydrogenase [Moraxellaceae bacterium AER2_44_116]
MTASVSPLRTDHPEVADMQRIFDSQKTAFRLRPSTTASERIALLDNLKTVLIKYQDQIAIAIAEDFGHRSHHETKFAEVLTSLENIKYYSKNLRTWMQPDKRHVNPTHLPAKAWVQYQPLGVVGIITPWNYPLLLAISPLICALAAGNRAMLKMSSFTPRTGETLKRALAEAFSEDQVAVITGGGIVSDAFSRLPFNQMTFTGSTNVGRTVMAAAAENLTPVLLELGGKSPAIVHDSVPMKDVAERIALGKGWNAGQTCVAPDYVFLPKGKTLDFVAAMRSAIAKMYPTMLNNPDYTSIVNNKQYQRIKGYLDDAIDQGAELFEINPANESFTNTRKMPVILVSNIKQTMQIAKNEIFGPVLMVMEYDQLEDALSYINQRPSPLALYYFDYDERRSDFVLRNTQSGGFSANDVITHVAEEDLPFGGVGHSGMGKYHGREGFMAMSNARSVLMKPKFWSMRFLAPPFKSPLHKLIEKVLLK